jgi:uracil-DNA glycosylase
LHLENRDLNSVEFPFGGVMVLGHNFDSEAGFNKSFAAGKEQLKTGTWGPLLKLLEAVPIPLGQCFFTNAFMGLCEGRDNKSYQGRSDRAFRAACLSFLKFQIELQRPRFILTLGLHVPPLLAYASSDLMAWKGKSKARNCDPKLHLKDLDATPIFNAARFELDDGSVHPAVVTAIAHPSDRRNGARRTLKEFDGELGLVREGWMRMGSFKT